jgi:desulfoferrodoxin (superoxide reductase-like protein)
VTKRTRLTRRGMLGLLGGTTVAACTVGVGEPPAVDKNGIWETRAKQLEDSSGTIYSAGNEGKWTGKSGTHVPSVVVNGDGTVTASCTHGMTDADVAVTPPVPQHYITTMFARDVDTGTVIHLVEFVTRGPAKAATATMTFKIPDGVSAIAVYAHCNEHDLWVSANTNV